ncbi:MAG: hypothetical protein JKY60_15180 [Kordiimonadaceae bacterium]|nr:hypothetical protein [Kordiimonadaceae bacterium]
MPTIPVLLDAASKTALKRPQLLLLLTILAGLFTSITYTPAARVQQAVMAALPTGVQSPQQAADDNETATVSSKTSEEAYAALQKIISDGSGTLLFGQLSLLVISGFLLPLWVRGIDPGGAMPWQGGRVAFVRRGTASFFHLLAAIGLTVIALTICLIVGLLLSSMSAGILNVVVIILLVSTIWLNIFFSAAANIAIRFEALDKRIKFTKALTLAQPFVRPIVGTFALIWFATFIANSIIGGFVNSVIPALHVPAAATFVYGCFMFLTAALHIAALSAIPGLRAQDQDF